MAISKRLRFEILRRDNHACRYCGRTAPNVELTVDHVIPTALGGSDDPDNLVAACSDCNGGKSSVPATAPLIADVANDALRWSQAMQHAADEYRVEGDRRAELHSAFEHEWKQWTNRSGDQVPKPESWRSTIDQVLAAGLSINDVIELVAVAMESQARDTWRYFCGCCWTRIRGFQDRAQELLRDPKLGEPSTPPLTTVWTEQQLTEHVASMEATAARLLTQESIESAYCGHRDWGGGDCGDPVCRAIRAEGLGWMSDSVILQKMRDENVIDAAEALLDAQ